MQSLYEKIKFLFNTLQLIVGLKLVTYHSEISYESWMQKKSMTSLGPSDKKQHIDNTQLSTYMKQRYLKWQQRWKIDMERHEMAVQLNS